MITKGVLYSVTKNSEDGTFREEDLIILLDDGSILTTDVYTIIKAENVPKAMAGVEYEPLTK